MIRQYEHRDFEDVDFLQRDFYLNPATQEELRGKLQNPSWVAVNIQPDCIDDAVVGCLITCPDADKTLVWSVVVARPHRGKGIGSALLEAAECFFFGTKLTLYVEPNNRAKNLYEKRGWRTAQYLKDFYGKGYDAVEMYKIC